MSADTDAQIRQWRGYLEGRRRIAAAEVDELEAHLRDQMADLAGRGLHDDEAFLVAVKRMGSTDAIAREFARAHSDRLWKQLVLDVAPDDDSTTRHELPVMLGLAVLAGLTACFGIEFLGINAAVNVPALLVFPFAYFAWKRNLGKRYVGVAAALFIGALVIVNAYPLERSDNLAVLAVIHLPIALWCVVGLGYVGGQWRTSLRRMDFVRFTGEFIVYYTLIALGGGIVCGLTVAAFNAVGVNPEVVVGHWLLPAGAAGAILVACWLVESKQDVIENMAPVLTRVFTPVTLGMIVAVSAAFAAHPGLVGVNRDVLVVMALVLVLVVGLLLYTLSARDPRHGPGWFDWLQLALVCAALVVDVVVLVAMITRIAEFGSSPNKAAALGLNLLLLVSLTRAAWLQLGWFRGRATVTDLERWQTFTLPFYGLWAAIVVVIFPPIFHFN